MIKKLLAILIIAVLAILGLASRKADTFSIEREITIKAPPEKIFALINDFHHWDAWSPWEKRDPAMKKTFSGANSGNGAVYAWDGNNQVGAGRMEIIETIPPVHIIIQLDFSKPMTGHNIAEFKLDSEGDITKVTCGMTGQTPFLSKVIQVFMSMDKMVGADFESGLANLKVLAEK